MSKAKDTNQVPEFDADLSPKSDHNRQVAEKRGLRYDPESRYYRDEDGALVRDKFGQPL